MKYILIQYLCQFGIGQISHTLFTFGVQSYCILSEKQNNYLAIS
ncbi:Uncharacterised protein [Segatella copri]|nr:Uncharacterised protein [Segatella copri]